MAGTSRTVRVALVGAFLVAVGGGTARGAGFVPPPDDHLVNVQADAGAKGDGLTDDTAALKAVFEAGKANPHPKFGNARFIYIPDGVYLVSDRIHVGDKRKFIIGQSRDGTVIRLKDRSPGFQDPAKPLPVINFGSGSRKGWQFAQNFNQRMLNLTIEVGKGNPGATAVLYHTNNSGGLYHLTLRSSDPDRLGAYGLHLSSGPGPGLVWDVLVDGFNVGCRIDGGLHSMTVAKLTVRNQRQCGYEADDNLTSLWQFRSTNRVPAIVVRRGHFVLLDAECDGGATDEAAVRVEGGMVFCRNVKTSGYGKALVARPGKAAEAVTLAGPTVEEFVRPKAYSLFGNPAESLDLPIEEPPISVDDWGDAGSWTVIKPGPDSGQRIQKAIDDGAEQIYLLGGELHRIYDTIHVRNKVRRIFGVGTVYRTVADPEGVDRFGQDSLDPGAVPGAKVVPGIKKPLWLIEDGEPDTVYLEFINDSYGKAQWKLHHASKRTLVCRNAGGLYRNSVTGGKAFFLDAGPGAGTVIKGPQQVWAWQTNTESYVHNPHILNDGGMLVICGYKIEKDRTNVGTIGGGWTEVLGGLLYKNRQRIDMQPAFVNRDSNLSVSIGHAGKGYDALVVETRGRQVRALTPQMLGGQWVPLYAGWQQAPGR